MGDCQVLRVFTRGEVGGNHLGVITDVAGLAGAAMQEIAAGLGFSETVFLDCTRPVPLARIFTPAAEIPFAGHPLVGAGWVLGAMGPGRRVACGIGEVPFHTGGDGAWIEVAASREVEEVSSSTAAGAGLGGAARAWMVRLPLRYLLLEVPTAVAVEAVRPDFGRLAAESWEGTLLFARAGGAVKARFFAPALGVAEDPATGSAAVALASALASAGEREGSLVIDQGDEVGAPSRISLRWSGGMVTVGGTVRRDEVRALGR
ncbi:MAG TPA: PhzF family phenazine biosynthesis protein [Acidimicrobiia bacterium]|nr:PhzF family phenazine biosynthesis protein [Acidimicrobiia bacterium]